MRSGVCPCSCVGPGKVKVEFIGIAHFMYKTIQSALHEIKALQQVAEKSIKNM